MGSKKETVDHIAVRAGILACFQLGIWRRIAPLILEAKERNETEPNPDDIVFRSWQDTVAIYEQNGGQRKYIRAALGQSNVAGDKRGTLGVSPTVKLSEVLEPEMFRDEVATPVRALGHKPESLSLSDALGAVSVLIRIWGILEGWMSADAAKSTDSAKSSLTAKTKDESNVNWPLLGTVGAGVVGLSLWNSYQQEKRSWENARQELEAEVRDLKAHLADLEERASRSEKVRKHHIDDPMKAVAIAGAIEKLKRDM